MEGIELTPTRVVSIVLLGVVGTGIAYLINYRSIAELGSTKASVVTYLVPVVAVVVGVLFLDEAFEAGLVVGGALTIVGIAMLHGRLFPTRTPVARRRTSSARALDRAAHAATLGRGDRLPRRVGCMARRARHHHRRGARARWAPTVSAAGGRSGVVHRGGRAAAARRAGPAAHRGRRASSMSSTRLPPDLPVGYHRLVRRDGAHVTRLIVSPRTCFLPESAAHVGLGGAALRPALAGELGHRRPRRSTAAGALVARSSGRAWCW